MSPGVDLASPLQHDEAGKSYRILLPPPTAGWRAGPAVLAIEFCYHLPTSRRKTPMRIHAPRLRTLELIACLVLVVTMMHAPTASAQDQKEATMKLSFPGEYVRRVETGQAVLVLGYRNANLSLGSEWMLLEIAMTAQPGNTITLKRENFTLTTPDGESLPLLTQQEFNSNASSLRPLDRRANIQREPLSYLPPQANQPCRIGFFSDLATPKRGPTWEEFTMSPNSFCAGRLYFKVPGGIEYGRYYLEVALPEGEIAAPMLIMTKEELKDAKAKVKAYEKEQKRLKKDMKKKARDES
jgi:hypothetical protein